MGNCIWAQRKIEEEDMEQERELEGDFEEKDSVKVKIVLTKEELEWLMLQLKVNEGKNLEDVLLEIQREREKIKAWKPCLESILEIPEAL
ncbi:uncharacterized protein LOC110628963 [Manihot esculenta]|uniref:Uncharacterized protein n=1 Tax=Manihot esculenta TaxID=3983 RepID=A0A2C9WKG3_MANES|nr:uncharacterized protein LOC110628963 [Manihot esculenta]OAY59662.1 hypothetical protein MANES_01G049200v8 [Manihot esculenta]